LVHEQISKEVLMSQMTQPMANRETQPHGHPGHPVMAIVVAIPGVLFVAILAVAAVAAITVPFYYTRTTVGLFGYQIDTMPWAIATAIAGAALLCATFAVASGLRDWVRALRNG
jgi:hypothetical protein